METKEFVYELNFAEKTGNDKAFVEDLWARRKVGHLLDQIRVQGETKEVVDEVIQLAKRYGITTPYTSYLLVPDGPVAMGGMGMGGMGGMAPLALQPGGGVGVAGGAGAAGAAGGAPIPVADFAKQLGDGKDKVAEKRISQENDRLKEEAKKGKGQAKKDAEATLDQQSALQKAQANFRAGSLHNVQNGKLGVDFAVQNNALRFQNQTVRTASRFVQNRTVVEVGGVWIDDGFNAKLETVTIKAQSDAYFKLLERHPEVKEVLQLGNYIIWVTPSGKALIIDQGHGQETMPDADIDRLFVATAKSEPKK
jgi:Ca-activated chloride channel family protein